MILEKYKHALLVPDANYRLIPVTVFDINQAGADAFNEIFEVVKHYEGITRMTRTPSGGISISRKNFLPPMYDVKQSKSCVELTVLLAEGMWRFQFRKNFKAVDTVMGGTEAINRFAKKLKELTGIVLEDYLIENGLEERADVPRYIIKSDERFCPEVTNIDEAPVWENVHHIDFHSSFAGGLANTYPEFRSTLEWFYERRKSNPKNKGVLNSTIGKMWSKSYKNCGYVRLAKAAIADNNRRVLEVTKALEENGRVPLLWNTDGVWYYGDVYHGEGEGKGLGQWENDHINCTFRVKSRGSYEFIENGEYHPVVRGVDNEKKSTWKWGDIFSPVAEIEAYAFSEERGIYLI